MESPCLPIDLVCEFLTNPLAVEETKPRLSWKIADERLNARQSAYQIVASTDLEKLESKPNLWDTKWVKSDQQLDIEWAGKALKSRMKVYWQVRVKDARGKESPWSEVASFEMGLLQKKDWSAKWITNNEVRPGPSPYLRKPFAVQGHVVQARLMITSCGIFEAALNGQKIGNDVFTPGWTDYQKRIPYMTYDVTTQIQDGDNVLGVVLADGWYAGNLGYILNRNIWGDCLALLAELHLVFSHGREETIVSDTDWKWTYGAIRESDIYDGETVDTRLILHNWDRPFYDDSAWASVEEAVEPKAKIVAKPNLPVRPQEELAAIEQTEPEFGVHVFDLGQNMVGNARIKLYDQWADDVVTIRYAEMLNKDGTLYTENLRKAKCIDRVICNGEQEIWFEPKFTFHGFRYVELTGLRRKPTLDDVTGVVLHSEIPSTGKFECSEPLINQLQQNILWGQKGNFLEAPTDCPQRDERLGWTGDAQIFIGTAAFNRDVAGFFEKYCADMEDGQFADGRVPHVVPNPFRNEKGLSSGDGGQAAWADAVVICSWKLYLHYHDQRVLERHYESMKKFIDWRIESAKNWIHHEAMFGDWLAIDIPSETNCAGSATPKDLIATAYFAYTTNLFSKIAEIIGKKADAKKYQQAFQKIKKAFQNEFVTSNGRIGGDTQCSYLLALGFDLLPETLKEAAGKNLVKALDKWKGHLATGFVGTPLLAPVLTSIGRSDLAYQLLMKRTYPSWLYTVLQGATTMWERWNSYTKENGFGSPSMNSFNHYAYGAIGEWMYSTIGGIQLDEKKPGYKQIRIEPKLDKEFTYAKTELMTRYGKLSTDWKIEDGQFVLMVEIPANTKAEVILPGSQAKKNCGAGKHEFVLPVEEVFVETVAVKKSKQEKKVVKPKVSPKKKTNKTTSKDTSKLPSREKKTKVNKVVAKKAKKPVKQKEEAKPKPKPKAKATPKAPKTVKKTKKK